MLIQPEPGLLIWTIVTFLLLLFILGKFAWKPILGALEEREKSIRSALDESKKARDEAEQLLEKNRAILADARNQANEVLERARRDAETRRAEAVEKARQESESMLVRSKEEIERQKRMAVNDIRREAADLAVQAASRVVRGSLDSDAHRRLVDEYFQSLPGDGGTA